MNVPAALIAKYSGSGPRYTSYPTAAEFNADFSAAMWQEELSAAGEEPAAAFYIHLPFCHSLCYFCACHKFISASRAPLERYLQALKTEMRLYSAALGEGVTVDHLHLGGGTPNFLNAKELEALIAHFDETFPQRTDDAELSIELDPRTVTPEFLRALALVGFSRISCGVQDFDPVVQEAINRRQTFAQTSQLIDSARKLGILAANIDLIYGLPCQTPAGFGETLDRVLELRPDRIALYGYAHLPTREKVQTTFRRFPLPSPEERIALFSLAVNRLCAAGYEHVGMDHFALPEDSLVQALRHGALRRNFMGYTDRVSQLLIGLGASSISCTAQAFAQNEKELGSYERRVLEEKQLPVWRGLRRSKDDCIRADLIERLLCERRVDTTQFSWRWKIDFEQYFCDSLPGLAELERDGLVQQSGSTLEVTTLGVYFLRNIAMVFDRYRHNGDTAKEKLYSQTI